jgi:glycerol uptake facilitator-like aquaporin
MASSKDVKALLTEFFGTFFIVFISCWTLASLDLKSINYLGVALANGFTLAACAWAGISSSGAHFNPVVTIVKLSVRHFSVSRTTAYIFTQLLASVVAAQFVKFITPSELDNNSTEFPYPTPNYFMQDFQIFILEFIGSALYVYAYFSFIIDKRAPTNVFGFGLAAVIMVCTLAFGALSGGWVNPIRIFGPQIVSGNFNRIWTYWLASIFGGVFAGFYYDFFILKNSEFDFNDEEEDTGKNMKTTENISQALGLKY